MIQGVDMPESAGFGDYGKTAERAADKLTAHQTRQNLFPNDQGGCIDLMPERLGRIPAAKENRFGFYCGQQRRRYLSQSPNHLVGSCARPGFADRPDAQNQAPVSPCVRQPCSPLFSMG